MIRKILTRHVSPWQIALYALANLAGLAIVLCAMQFYRDCRPILAPGADDDALARAGLMVLTKPVGMLGGADTRFSAAEVQELRSQPWVRDAAGFTAAQFGVTARVDVGREGLATMMFLESVPDQFLDTIPPSWGWTPAAPYVPVMISSEYLALYNFGFASARGMRKLSPQMISQVPVTLTLSGPGGVMEMPARVVGFSQTLNTIAVPQAFMDWANARIAPGADTAPSRLIVRPVSLAAPEAETYIAAAGYDTASPSAAASRMGQTLRLVTGAVAAIGGVICLLALVLLMLSIHLLLQRSRDSISTLLLLGYTPWQLARCYAAMVTALNAAIAAAAIAVLALACRAWRAALAPMGIEGAGLWATAAAGLGIAALLTAYNILALRRGIHPSRQ